MASKNIAGAVCVGKGAFDRAPILLTAHAAARSKIANNRAWRSYREAFAVSLKAACCQAKEEAAIAAIAAEDAATAPEPAVITQRVADLRLFASAQSFTASGTARFRKFMAEADQVAWAARCMMIPAKDQIHVAH